MIKLDMSPEEFNKLSQTKKKQYIAQLFIRESGATPVPEDETPIVFIMAGLPGAGKTEFLDSLAEEIAAAGGAPFVRIDLDEIVSIYPNYSPKDYYKFRSQGNLVLARTVDVARRGRYNMLIDGTFSGMSGASVDTVTQLLSTGYRVNMVYMYDTAKSAWYYTNQRKIETGRTVDKAGFIRAATNLPINVRRVIELHGEIPFFTIFTVVQKEIRDKDYVITTQKRDIDNIISLDYNIDEI